MPRKSIGSVVVPNFEDNDDEREKLSRRKSLVLTGVVNSPTSVSRKSNTIEMNSVQITEHYGACIQLASENKINSKNAFKLHLIDHLKNQLKGLESFQMATSSLDAGSKIYASRVDHVHQNTYQVLTGLGSKTANTENLNNSEVEDNGDNPLVEPTKKSRKKRNADRNFFAADVKKIRLAKNCFRVDSDPLFQREAKKFDECGAGQLRLQKLRFVDRTGALLLDGDTVVFKDVYDNGELEQENICALDLTEIAESALTTGPIKLSAFFSNFRFTGWQSEEAVMDSETVESFRQYRESVQQLNGGVDAAPGVAGGVEAPLELDDDCVDYGAMNGDCPGDYNVDEPVMIDEEDNFMDATITIGSSHNGNANSVFLSSVTSHVASVMENGGDVSSDVLGLWAGPEHWQVRARRIKAAMTVTKPHEPRVRRKEAVPEPPLFPENVEQKPSSQNPAVKLAMLPPPLPLSKLGLCSQISEEKLDKNTRQDYLLPPSTGRSKNGLLVIRQMMNRDVSLLSRALREIVAIEQDQSDTVKTEIGVNAECGSQVVLVADLQGNVKPHDDDHLDDMLEAGDDDGDVDAYLGASLTQVDDQDLLENDDILLDAGIRRVQQIDVGYAKTAKRINVKRLKVDIFRHIHDTTNANNSKLEIGEGNFPERMPMADKHTTMSHLLRTIDDGSSKEMAADFSVPIILTCLLHLSNEKGLNLVSKEDISDLSIGQGFNDYDIEMIRQFGDTTSPATRKTTDDMEIQH